MDHHRFLYKSNVSALTPKISKRKAVHEMRATKRSELFSSTRNLSVSPSPNKQKDLGSQQKENELLPQAVPSVKLEGNVIASTEPPAKVNEKQSRQKAYLMRFLAWKAERAKEAQLKEQKLKRAPFIVPTKNVGVVDSGIVKKTFAPKNHVFNPPANLKDITVQIMGLNSIRLVDGEKQATYHFVETPKKKKNFESKVAPTRTGGIPPIPPSRLMITKPAVHKTPISDKRAVQQPTLTVIERKSTFPATSTKKVIPRHTPNTLKVPPFPPTSMPKTAVRSKVKPSKTPVRPQVPPPSQLASQQFIKPQRIAPLRTKMRPPPPTQQTTRVLRKPPTSTAAATIPPSKQGNLKSGQPPLKRPTFKASKKPSSSLSNAVQTVHANTRSKTTGAPPSLKLNGKLFLQSMTGTLKKPASPIPETPVEVNPERSFLNFVTSTKRKSSSSKDSNANLLFAELDNTISPIDDTCPTPAEQKSKLKNDKKFDFLRYSHVESDADKAEKTENEKAASEEVHATPEKSATPPTTYMSPYVSVSRGKVSTKIEREKRNSLYMAGDSTDTPPEITATVRHTLATIRYYRKQLMDEIARLNGQCDIWEQYKEANAKLIEDSGIDMINVTIGQTKLLTTKKLKQFGGLIDRCEDGVLGKSSTCTGGGEGIKPILPEDLEGFWSMVGLQIENVDKRFANLDRWKANNWTDPDEDKPKATNANLKKTKKRKPVTTARPNSALQKMLRTAHAAFLKKKECADVDEDIILTPSKGRQVLIRDRRSRSAAATVITVNTPRNSRQLSADLSETPKLLTTSGLRKSLLKSAHLNEQRRISPEINYESPIRHPTAFRKSILKTPGSRCRPKSVIFNSPPIQFTINDQVDDLQTCPNNKDNEEEDQRTYKLRNRKVVLRDSAEFVIPK